MVPGDGRALLLNVGAERAGGVDVHHRLGNLAPRGVDARHELLPGATLYPIVEAVLDGERQVGDRAEGGLHLVPAEARDDHDVVLGVGAQHAQHLQHGRRHLVLRLLAQVEDAVVRRRERAPPVEQDDPPGRGPHRHQHLLRVERLEGCAHAHHAEGGQPKPDGHPMVLLLALHRLEVGEEAAGPLLRGVFGDVFQVLAAARLALRVGHRERRVERLAQRLLREGVHDQRAVEHPREAGELGEHRHARGLAAERARHHVLERVGVDRLAHRRIDYHVRLQPQQQPGRQRQQRPLLVVHGARVARVDARHNPADLVTNECCVLDELHLVPGGQHDLNQHVTLAVLRVVGEQVLPREQLELHALEPVQVVHAGQHPWHPPRLRGLERLPHRR
mmetsp:Transcript_8851/g.29241  ORF Transcript_8851/g.29241 Transcript_8851/m.29241 type:complete len:390 (-) Transcript_8851:1314-2483(-)